MVLLKFLAFTAIWRISNAKYIATCGQMSCELENEECYDDRGTAAGTCLCLTGFVRDNSGKCVDEECEVKVSDNVHDAVFKYNHELILRLWLFRPNQPTNFTFSLPSRDPEAAQTYNMRILPTQNGTTWKKIDVTWPRPATNLSIITAGTEEKLDEHQQTNLSSDSGSFKESDDPLGLHITSDHLLIWLNTDPKHLEEENCQEAVYIVNRLLKSNGSIPSYISKAVRLPGPDGNLREFDQRTAIIVILSIFLIVALLSLAVICCYIRQHTPHAMAQYESVKFEGHRSWRDEVTEELPKQHL